MEAEHPVFIDFMYVCNNMLPLTSSLGQIIEDSHDVSCDKNGVVDDTNGGIL